MKPFSTPDLSRMNARELAAFQADVLKGVAVAREATRKGLALDQEVTRVRTQRRVFRQNL